MNSELLTITISKEGAKYSMCAVPTIIDYGTITYYSAPTLGEVIAEAISELIELEKENAEEKGGELRVTFNNPELNPLMGISGLLPEWKHIIVSGPIIKEERKS